MQSNAALRGQLCLSRAQYARRRHDERLDEWHVVLITVFIRISHSNFKIFMTPQKSNRLKIDAFY